MVDDWSKAYEIMNNLEFYRQYHGQQLYSDGKVRFGGGYPPMLS